MAAIRETGPGYMERSLLYHALQRVYIHSMASSHFQIDRQYIFLMVPILGSNIFLYFLQDMLQTSFRHRLVNDLRNKELIKGSINTLSVIYEPEAKPEVKPDLKN